MSSSSKKANSSSSSSKKTQYQKKAPDKRRLGRKNPIVFSGWSEEEKAETYNTNKANYESLSNSKEPEPFSACHIWKGSTQNGYPSISQGHGASKIKMHILAAERKLLRTPTREECVSHLCHRKKCINPDHLSIESLATNNSRKGAVPWYVESSVCPR